jgi:hypothetical protein
MLTILTCPVSLQEPDMHKPDTHQGCHYMLLTRGNVVTPLVGVRLVAPSTTSELPSTLIAAPMPVGVALDGPAR